MSLVRRETLVAVGVVGPRNITCVGPIRVLCDMTLDLFAKSVKKKRPGLTYYIYEYSEGIAQRRKHDPLYVWHVGEGHSHSEGWWVETDLEAA
jgi:hypothetical protein